MLVCVVGGVVGGDFVGGVVGGDVVGGDVVGGVVGGDVVGVDSLSEIEIFHPLRKQQIIITLAMLVYTRFERMRFHTMLSYVMEIADPF